jgi:hypothetical protein
VDVHAFHLPGFDAATAGLELIAERDGVRVLAPALTPDDLSRVCDALLQARARLLDLPVARVIDAIDAAARRLRDPADPERTATLQALVAITGYAPAMAALVLDRMCEDWLAPALHRLVRSELGGTHAIDGFLSRSRRAAVRATAPPLGLHVFAGNVPGVSVTSVVRALLVRSAVLGKSALGEPVLAPVFARLLTDADPAVGACVALTYWRGGDAAIEAAVLHRVRLVVHYGGLDALASLRARAADGTRFIDHGPRISFAVVRAAPGVLPQAARDTARAVALFDQQGCVSPQLAYVIGSAAEAKEFAAAVADALRALHATLPRGRLDAGEAAAVRELRTRAEFRAISGEDVELWVDDALAFSVVYDPDPAFSGSCLNRTLLVKRVAAGNDLIERVRSFGRYLQTVGLAGFDDPVEPFAAALGEIGATRIAPISAMPWPPVDWHHDGRGPLRELVRWVDLER